MVCCCGGFFLFAFKLYFFNLESNIILDMRSFIAVQFDDNLHLASNIDGLGQIDFSICFV